MSLQPGTRLGHYETEGLLGEGGMGVVYKARDVRLKREAAIKILAPQFAGDAVRLRRFEQEAQAASALNHPNIATIYEIDTQDGTTFIAMEYVAGQPLREVIPSDGLPSEAVVRYGIQVAEAIEHAHRHGIIHRDLKSANVMISAESQVKVLDFGLASRVPAAEMETLTRTHVGEGDVGPLAGTLAYLAPEVLRGNRANKRSDVWALGVMLYEMASGKLPFQGLTLFDLTAAILDGAASPLPPKLSISLRAVIGKCLARDPAQRYQHAGEVRVALDTLQSGSDPSGICRDEVSVGVRRALPRAAARPSASSPSPAPKARQEIRYCVTRDGVRLAYATTGSGPPLVKASNWLTHLDFEWSSPIWRHWYSELSRHHRLVRYDERGNGLSQRDVHDVSFDTWVRDLETVVDAAGLDRFSLLGISRGGSIAIAYAVKHSERVTHLVLHGAFAAGLNHYGTPQEVEARRALTSLVRLGWGLNNPAFCKTFTCRFIPEATPEHEQWFDQLQRMSTSPENAARLMDIDNNIDVRRLLSQVKTPTLVLHCDRDHAVVPERGRELAAAITGARYISLPSANHLMLEDEPAWSLFLKELSLFLNS